MANPGDAGDFRSAKIDLALKAVQVASSLLDFLLDLVRVDHESNRILRTEVVALGTQALYGAFRILDPPLTNQPPRRLGSEAHGDEDRNRPNPLDLEDGRSSVFGCRLTAGPT